MIHIDHVTGYTTAEFQQLVREHLKPVMREYVCLNGSIGHADQELYLDVQASDAFEALCSRYEGDSFMVSYLASTQEILEALVKREVIQPGHYILGVDLA